MLVLSRQRDETIMIGDEIELTTIYDQSRFISSAVDDVKAAAVIGGLIGLGQGGAAGAEVGAIEGAAAAAEREGVKEEE